MEEEVRSVETVNSNPEATQSSEGMQDLLEAHGHGYRTLKRGDIVEGVVVRIDRDEVLVDIGSKSEGVIPAHEMRDLHGNVMESLRMGDEILVYVLQPENQDGHVVLSLNRAETEKGWRVAQKQFEEGTILEAEIIEYNKGGLIANVEGVRGFVPLSQIVDLRSVSGSEESVEERLKAMRGRKMFLKVIEINRRRNRLILSERAAVQERRAIQKDRLLSELKEGDVRHGRVSSLCDFGAFIDLGGADGLVHLSELSWGQVSHPSQLLKVGQEVDTMVVGVDRENKKIALSLKRLQPEPWTGVAERYHVGEIVTGRITKLASFGAFARIEEGVEGLIHISELSDERIAHPKGVVKEGDEVQLRIIRIDPSRRRLGLSLRQAREEGYEEGSVAVGDTAPATGTEDRGEEVAHKVPSSVEDKAGQGEDAQNGGRTAAAPKAEPVEGTSSVEPSADDGPVDPAAPAVLGG
ncbi:MAG TPA: 30S ribosomal protein S1 [Chloroflexota bacterium]|nr:30S ribosomal protein S1 [Chloroflexota bacterium]